MKLNKTAKILVGIGTAWVVIYPFLFIAVWFVMMFGMLFTAAAADCGAAPFPFFMLPFFAIFPISCLGSLVHLALIAFYLIHIIKNTAASETVRIILGIGIFMLSFIAMPVYYYLYVWLDTPPAWAMQNTGGARTA